MLKATINKKNTLDLIISKDTIVIDGTTFDANFSEHTTGMFNVISNDRSHNAQIIEVDRENKTAVILVNDNKYSVQIKDKFDELLHSLGMDNLNAHKMNDLKAPMPGLVLKVLIVEGQEVKKDDGLLILEAMKMENLIKAPADGVVKSIKVKAQDKTEKNQVLITFV